MDLSRKQVNKGKWVINVIIRLIGTNFIKLRKLINKLLISFLKPNENSVTNHLSLSVSRFIRKEESKPGFLSIQGSSED